MAVIKEWKCPLHGPFEGSHPICPHFNCESEGITQEFRTAPKVGSDRTRRVDKTLSGLASEYGLSNMSNRDGKAVADGASMVWASPEKTLGITKEALIQSAKTPTEFGEEPSGMRQAWRDGAGFRPPRPQIAARDPNPEDTQAALKRALAQ